MLSAIKDDSLVPQFKSPICVLCGMANTCAHCVTRCARLLVPVLSKPCAVIVFGIQLVQYKIGLE